MSETVNAQELNCQLVDSNLVWPLTDEWESIQDVVRPWIDCWFDGAEAEFTVPEPNQLEVAVNDTTIIKMELTPTAAYPLKIEVLDDESGEFEGDSYSYRFQSS
ncbi:hypothetical protein CMI47_21435 [Candidatus Pacearchaeota archaeon]|nr:hypothetical protein [Candidatus Pacearchaeota archaeon]|tara:strand:+ start:1027 stop:1338 length:312 start_codon:yes stop_codon:yes gene_type:complete